MPRCCGVSSREPAHFMDVQIYPRGSSTCLIIHPLLQQNLVDASLLSFHYPSYPAFGSFGLSAFSSSNSIRYSIVTPHFLLINFNFPNGISVAPLIQDRYVFNVIPGSAARASLDNPLRARENPHWTFSPTSVGPRLTVFIFIN